MMKMKCAHCGAEIDERASVCPNCGASQRAGTTSSPQDDHAPRRSPKLAIGTTIACLALAGLVAAVYLIRERSDGEPAASQNSLPDFPETKRKAEGGDAQAALTLGDFFAEGQHVRQDYKQAAEWYRKGADQGVAEAQYKLGVLYDIGQGVSKDESEAAQWYGKAAEQGNPDAQYTLASMFGLGRGVARNPQEALRWYERAAEQGDALARYNLAERYERGRDVPQDLVEAYKWHSLAAERGL